MIFMLAAAQPCTRLESLSEFAERLAASVDIVFPVIHGRFGKDGGIQELLEEYNIPFVGTGSNECCQAFDKYDASLELSKQGFITVPSFIVQGNERNESELSKWFARNQLDPNSGKVVVKPARAGSRIGVKVAYGGSEFTALVLDVGSGLDCHPVVLLPTEIERDDFTMQEVKLGSSLMPENFKIALAPTTAIESLKFPPAALAFPAKPNHHLTLKTFRLPNTQYAPPCQSP
ncbi:d-alanine--d-alanine ligase [Fagus crenata]